MYTFAVIEDDESTNDMLKGYLQNLWADCVIQQIYTTEAALKAIAATDFDVVVSDIDMGRGSDMYGGLKVAKALDAVKCPLLIVSGSPHPDMNREIFRALDAWDYLQKPVSEVDFARQIKRGIAFRHAQLDSRASPNKSNNGHTRDPDLIIDPGSRKCTIQWKGQTIRLTLTQISLLELLVEAYDQVVSYDRLMEEILTGKNKENLRMHMSKIRKAFESVDPDFACLTSSLMNGYRWRE
jgi:DNA-binding response OmpR family regulator